MEIAMFAFGIVTLVKGRFQLSRNRVVEGMPAYAIGALLVGALPLAVVLGFVGGIVIAAQNGGQADMKQLSALAGIDVVVVLLTLVTTAVIGFAAGKPKRKPSPPFAPFGPPGAVNPPLPPADPNNPYAAPRSDDRDRLLDEMQ